MSKKRAISQLITVTNRNAQTLANLVAHVEELRKSAAPALAPLQGTARELHEVSEEVAREFGVALSSSCLQSPEPRP
jgi:hypothetical protein